MDAHEIHGANHVKIGCELAEVSEIVSKMFTMSNILASNRKRLECYIASYFRVDPK